MILSDSAEAVALQSIWKRTHKGRVLREPAIDVLGQPYDENRGRVECPNCGFIYGEEWFKNGCPNCNSREAINDGR